MAKVCKFQLEKELVSFDCGYDWTPTGNKRKISGQEPVEKPSSDCGWSNLFLYKWVDDESGYTCNGYDKYSTRVQYYSYDQGDTWEKVNGSEQIGTLMEQFSSDCCYIRTITGTTCDKIFRPINVTLEEASLDQELWVYTGRYTIDSVGEFSEQCLYAAKDTLKFFGKPVSGTSGTAIINCENYLSECDDYDDIMNSGCVIICCEAGDDYCCSNPNYSSPHCSWHSYGDNGNIEELYVFDCAVSPSFCTNSQNTLKKIHISSGVTGIFGGSASDNIDYGGQFSNCTGLTEIEGLGSSNIEGLAIGMFENCTSLTSVELPESLYTLGADVFEGCTSLTSVTFNNKSLSMVHRSQTHQFAGCTALTTVVFPSDFYGFLYAAMFAHCTSLTSVEIPDNVNIIDNDCFNGCTSLSSITLGNVETIGQRAFQGCTSLTDVYIKQTDNILTNVYSTSFPSGVTIHVPCEAYGFWEIGVGSHPELGWTVELWGDSGCVETQWVESGTTCVDYDKYSRYIEQYRYGDKDPVWRNSGNESAVTLIEEDSPDCGYEPGDWAVKVTYEDSSVKYSQYTGTTLSSGQTRPILSGYQNTHVEIGSGITTLGNSCFHTMSGITSIIIPENVTTFENLAFWYCSGLTSITISSAVTSIGSNVFGGLNSLTELTWNSSVSIGTTLRTLPSIETINFGGLCTSIPKNAFYGNYHITSLTIGNSVRSIGESAFQNCSSITNIAIGNGVASIGKQTFRACSSLTSVTCLATTPPTLGYDAFNNTNNCPIYVPSGSVNTYKSASGWSEYADRIQAIPNP